MTTLTANRNTSGWHWTKRGWRQNKPTPAAKKPKKLRFRKQVVVTAPPARESAGFEWRAPQIGQGMRLRPAPMLPSPEGGKRAMRPPRAAWNGKYDQLQPP